MAGKEPQILQQGERFVVETRIEASCTSLIALLLLILQNGACFLQCAAKIHSDSGHTVP